MTSFNWLASYPKSGNTWFRLLVANLAAGEEPVDINDLPERSGIASARGPFEFHTMLDSGLLSHDEADALRPRVYGAIAAETDEDEGRQPRLIKVHDAYVETGSGEALLAGAGAAAGAILIVRDPRDVAPSLANHQETTIDAAIDKMIDRAATFSAQVRRLSPQLRQRLLDWSGHAASWLDQRDLPVHLVRYEDLKAEPVETLLAAMDFVGRSATRAEAERAVDFADFKRLQAQERERGFGEWRARTGGALFFRSGETQGWRRELTPAQFLRLETAFAPMMRRLGYDLSIDGAG
jgi:hypothetical protein